MRGHGRGHGMRGVSATEGRGQQRGGQQRGEGSSGDRHMMRDSSGDRHVVRDSSGDRPTMRDVASKQRRWLYVAVVAAREGGGEAGAPSRCSWASSIFGNCVTMSSTPPGASRLWAPCTSARTSSAPSVPPLTYNAASSCSVSGTATNGGLARRRSKGRGSPEGVTSVAQSRARVRCSSVRHDGSNPSRNASIGSKASPASATTMVRSSRLSTALKRVRRTARGERSHARTKDAPRDAATSAWMPLPQQTSTHRLAATGARKSVMASWRLSTPMGITASREGETTSQSVQM